MMTLKVTRHQARIKPVISVNLHLWPQVALRRILCWFRAMMMKLAPSSKEERDRSSVQINPILKLRLKKQKQLKYPKLNRNSEHNRKCRLKNKETSSRLNKWCLERTKSSLQALLIIEWRTLHIKIFIKNEFNMRNKAVPKIWTTTIRWSASKLSKTRSYSNIIKEATEVAVVTQINTNLQR